MDIHIGKGIRMTNTHHTLAGKELPLERAEKNAGRAFFWGDERWGRWGRWGKGGQELNQATAPQLFNSVTFP
jgi:hypothetical protein